MPNAQEINNAYTGSRAYDVTSAVIAHVEFGSINLPSIPELPTVFVRFNSGSEYLFVGVPYAEFAEFEATCLRNIHRVGDNRSVGQYFNQHIRGCTQYARLHQ